MYLIGNGTVLTRNAEGLCIRSGGVVTDGGTIAAVGGFSELALRYPGAEVIDAHGGVIMPGLINVHMRSRRILCCAMDLPEKEPLGHYFVAEQLLRKQDRKADLHLAAAASLAAAAECIKNGITAVFDHHSSPGAIGGSLQVLASSYAEAGIRACLCYESSEAEAPRKFDEALTENTEFAAHCERLNSPMLAAAFGIGSPSLLGEDALWRCAKANVSGVPYHIIASRSIFDDRAAFIKYRRFPLERLDDAGLLKNDTLLAGCIAAEEAEAELLSKRGCTVALTPRADRLDGIVSRSVSKLLQKGAAVAIGTGRAPFDILRSAACFGENEVANGTSAAESEAACMKLLYSGNGSYASKVFKTRLGVLEPGAAADIIVMDIHPFADTDPYGTDRYILLNGSGHDCVMTMCSGRVLMKDRVLLSIEEKRIRAASEEASILRNKH